jgi:antitoxin (DNA-binding transcriptional repressor) of toxin-antitoxin stability system
MDSRAKGYCERDKTKIVNLELQQEYDEKMRVEETAIEAEQAEFHDMLIMPEPDVYKTLSHKIKFAYKWVVSNTNAKWIAKVDDDMYVRVASLQFHIEAQYGVDPGSRSALNDATPAQYYLIGNIKRNTPVQSGGHKNAEDPKYKPKRYPPWAAGSSGHAVSRPVAEYISENHDTLYNYQGEDTSIGIWLSESPFYSKVKYVTSNRFANGADCMSTNADSLGHQISIERIRECWNNVDESSDIVAAVAAHKAITIAVTTTPIAPLVAAPKAITTAVTTTPSQNNINNINNNNIDDVVTLINPTSLNLGARFDIIVKSVYARFFLQSLSSGSSMQAMPGFVRNMYLRHIEVWNAFKEKCKFKGDADWIDATKPCVLKNSGADFEASFSKTIKSINADGFDNTLGLIPVSQTMFNLNGAHRTAVALALNLVDMPVQMVKSANTYPWSWDFFMGKGFNSNYVDFAMLEFAINTPNSNVITFWPDASNDAVKIESAVPIIRESCSSSGILYRKTVHLNKQGVASLVKHAYGDQPWLDNKIKQLTEAYNDNEKRPVTFFYVTNVSSDLNDMVACKDKLRKHFDLPRIKNSVHIADFHEEATLMAEMTLNPNSVYFLNNHIGNSCEDVSKELANRVEKKAINPGSFVHSQDIMIDSGGVMSYFGLRPRTDIDILFVSAIDETYLGNGNGIHIEAHAFESNKRKSERAWGQPHITAPGLINSAIDLFADPENYGYCFGMKYVSLKQLVRYKASRNEPNKDQRDVGLIQDFLKSHPQ